MDVNGQFHLILSVLDAGLIFWVSWKRNRDVLLLAPITQGLISLGLALYFGEDMFHIMALMAGAVFIHGVVLALGLAVIYWAVDRRIGGFFLSVAVLIILISIDAFFIEPTWVEITRYTIQSTKLEHDLKIVVLSDIQTDRVGEYEREALKMAMAEQPDLILLPGDYIHERDPERWRAQAALLNELFHEAGLAAPMGVYAVQGNVEPPGAEQFVFAGLEVTYFSAIGRVELDELVVTGITLEQSYDSNFAAQGEEKFHIVLGHVPNFALGEVPADLLVAGHTHGGQVQLPFIGPLITLSDVPRRWAGGALVEREPGSFLVVSRGIGMERHNAPRLRFLCRPEIVVIEINSR